MILQVFLLIAVTKLISGDPCPFNKQYCDCQPDYRNPPIYDYDFVNCTSTDYYSPPTFTPVNGTKFSVNSFRISGSLASLPAYYLAPFSEIKYLELYDNRGSSQSWNSLAFYFCNITSMNLTNVEQVLPPPMALNEVGASGLQQLHIGSQGRYALQLQDRIFQNFTYLRSLSISGVPILQISESTFAGLESRLTSLHLVNTRYTGNQVPILKSVVKLPRLTDLWLVNVGISDIPNGYFSAFPKLRSLKLGYDLLVNNTEGGYFYDLPASLSSIAQTNAFLASVPKLVFAKQQEEGLSLDLSGNAIVKIEDGDFSSTLVINELIVRDSKMTSLDLTVLPKNAKRLDFGSNKALKSLTASSLEEITTTAQVIVNPSLETIDPRLANSFVRYRQFSLDLSNNQNMDCKNLVWITPYVICWKNIRIQDSYCSTGQPVGDYLRNIGFNCTVS